MSVIISLKDVVKTFGSKKNPVTALDSVSLEIPPSSFTLILGRSGSGKSTLLHLMAGLDTVTSGEIIVEGNNISRVRQNQLAHYRSRIGIIFQSYNLLENLNTMENIMMGAWAGGSRVTKARVEELLEQFNLSHRASANIKTLSGGEKQRVAIIRSLINNPSILFCDEPTGALDSQNEQQVMEILQSLNKAGMTIVMVSHNPDFEKIATKVIRMRDGSIIEDINKTAMA